ncbi:hypothetical protein GCM10011492_01850 [Flexivirga endophytica]|uniref:Uncharacterized protein n=1 Tax=Flexivirga endophytica TaxID=1849103 RepID=A0A916SSF0_9MICO|nr:hypothetical protein [Flexivirga endophytica]GGB15782.1 hypothetical protein GCM10011492_01850 [Flexivirga endophytica]GHB39823.1 hypothetical protein GCM10008112_05770 [Flexivirga endophytica]
MSHATATAVTAPVHQLVVPMPEVVIPDVGALERVQLAGAGQIVVRQRAGWMSVPATSISWAGPAKRAALNTSFPLS